MGVQKATQSSPSKYSALLKNLHDICLVRLINAGDLIAPQDYDPLNGKFMDNSFDPTLSRYWDEGFNSQFKSPIKRENIQSRVARAILDKPCNGKYSSPQGKTPPPKTTEYFLNLKA